MSFNYDFLKQANTDSNSKGVGYFNNLDYSICFRKEQYYCSLTYSVPNTSAATHSDQDNQFSIRNSSIKAGEAGAGAVKCTEDYLQLNGIRFCGHQLNEDALHQATVSGSAAVTDQGQHIGHQLQHPLNFEFCQLFLQ
ncbi:unnamed protein product, partial [Oppiella nova]